MGPDCRKYVREEVLQPGGKGVHARDDVVHQVNGVHSALSIEAVVYLHWYSTSVNDNCCCVLNPLIRNR